MCARLFTSAEFFFHTRGDGRAGLKLSRNGGFIGCSAYPECKFVRPLKMYGGDDEAETDGLAFPHVLGADPDTGLEVALKLGPYGPSVPSPERGSSPRLMVSDSHTTATAERQPC